MGAKQKTRRRISFDRSDLMAFLAVIISVGAFLVSIYEANILKEQQSIMVSQQKASVWPYLEASISYHIDEEYMTTTVKVRNKGVGPAKLKDFSLIINKEKIEDYNEITKVIGATYEDSSAFAHSYLSPSGVLSKNDEITILEVKKERRKGDLLNFKRLDIAYELCFCSIYDDCWTITEKEWEPIEGCSN